MEERTRGIILRVRLFSETSLIVHWLTAEAGRVATLARGARRAKSAWRGRLDLFHEAEISFRRSRKSELHTLGEVVLTERYGGLREDWRRLNQAAYAVALVELTTETDTPLPGTWALVRDYLGHVSRSPVQRRSVLALELRHLEELGLLPELDRDTLPPASQELAQGLLTAPWEDLGGLAADEAAVRPLLRFLHGFLIHELGRLPKGRAEALGDPPEAREGPLAAR